MKLPKIGIAWKFVVLSVLGITPLACLAATGLWTLYASSAAGAKAPAYARKMVLTRMDEALGEWRQVNRALAADRGMYRAMCRPAIWPVAMKSER